jgi:cell surface protein SprA
VYTRQGRTEHKILLKGRLALPFIIFFLKIVFQTETAVAQNPGDSSRFQLRYPISENNYPFSTSGIVSPMLLRPPSNVEQTIVYDPASGRYVFSEKVGQLNYRTPASMSLEEYRLYEAKRTETDYWREKSREESGAGPSFMQNLRLNNQAVEKVFGSDVISITPQGSAELIFGYNISKYDNPLLPVRNRRNGSFIFKEKIQMSVTGSIGDKMEVGINYNTDATFDFENKTKLEYAGKEDEIIKKIEAGDVSFSLPGTLITGSQSLFGLKTELQFGHLTVTSVISHQRGESSSISVQGGAQLNEFEIDADEYDVNRHFFLSHFFRDNYNKWLENMPYVESQVQIQQIEVWIVNRQNDYTEAKNIVAFMDLGEGLNPDGEPNFYAESVINSGSGRNQPASNNSNTLYDGLLRYELNIRNISTVETAIEAFAGDAFETGRDYIKLESARPLSEREFSVNNELGYISLNSPLRNDEILAVAYTYTYRGRTYKVGELASEVDGKNVVIVKMLKGTTPSPKYPSWDLMMKNVYAIGAYQVNSEGFVLNILYRNDKTGIPVNYLSESDTSAISSNVQETPLLKVMELDNLDSRNEPNPDGQFDFIEGLTINSSNGRIYFPLLEPFGSDLRRKITDDSDDVLKNRTADKYVFQELYDSTRTKAEQIAEKNKFTIWGEYKSASSSDIQLNAMNIPRGSVVVTAGGTPLTEGADYTVDYTLGRVKIINSGLLESDVPINIKLESNSLFNIQTKTLLGTHLDYRFSENFNIGATIMNLTERPLTEKVNMGDEPISNTIWGLNTSYRTESQLLTTIIDKIPLIETKQPSSISVEAEFAHLIPGQSKTIGKNGVAYIDDFEAAQTKIEMKSFMNWTLASPPKDNLFLYGDRDSLSSGFGRAKLAWYIIDPLFYGSSGLNPGNQEIQDDIASHYARRIEEKEIFPEKDNTYPGQNYLSVLNLAYYPNERGPYNFDTNLEPDGSLPDPGSRWGGMMRDISWSDFETANIEFIEFWMMDPFHENPDHEGGDLYIHLGEISEDILRDNRKSFEGGLPKGPDDVTTLVDSTVWGFVPRRQAYETTFAPEARQYQDVGLDGLSDDAERNWDFYQPFLNQVNNVVESESARQSILNDLSGDNFEYFLSDNHDALGHGIFDRYKKYNNLENNSPTAEESGEEFSSSNKNSPDIEDINDDNTLNIVETYFQYHVSMTPEDLQEVGENYIVDRVEESISGYEQPAVWYQFRIPLAEWESKIGDIEDFRSIRFMRVMLSGFEEEVVLRFATLDLVRGEWRRYNLDISETAPVVTQQRGGTTFEVSAVNIEENSEKEPVNYVLPPGVSRVIDPSNQQLAMLNEQSILLKVKDLADGDARSVFKNVQLDLRQYKKMEMHIHAEALPGLEGELDSADISAFIRIGSDYQNNYYEYEIPLAVTPPGVYGDGSYTVWPATNRMDLVLEEFVNLKKERNEMEKTDPLNFSSQSVYSKRIAQGENGRKTIKVKGNPNLGNIRQIMIGIRNPGDAASYERVNDGLDKSAEVWFNELRLTDFNDRGGWAANGRVQAQLADFGVLNVAGSTSKPGFGSIEQKVNERSMEEVNQYDISSNLELGKFFPEKAQVSIPFYISGSKTIVNPEYFPRDPDIKFKDVLDAAESKAERDSLKKISQDHTSRKSINITNMRWNKKFKKWDIFSPANLTASVGYTDTRARSYSTEYNNLWKYMASLNYVFNTRPKNIQPFRKSKSLRKPALRIIRDFNFNPYPSRFTFGTVFDRNYQEIKIRDVTEDVELLIEPTVNKDFTWDRKYGLKWDLTRGLKVDYSATNSARIDEPAGQTDLFKANNREWKDSVWTSIWRDRGRNMSFSQKLNVSYTVPINKIPIFNWVSLNTSYGSTYSWIRGEVIPNRRLGNTLKNSNTVKVNSNLNLRSLYSKVGYLKNIEAKYGGRGRGRGRQSEEDTRYKTVSYERRTFFRKDEPKNIFHKLKTDNIEVKVVDENGQEIEVKTTVVNENKITITASEDITGVTVYVTGKIPKGENPFVFLGENTIRFLTGFKSINVSWTRTVGTFLPGYLPETNYLGISTAEEFYGAPGFPFAFGQQNDDIIYYAIDNGWLTTDTLFSKSAEFTRNEQINIRTTFEPFRGFRIDFTAMRSYSEYNEQIFFHDTPDMELANYGNYFVDNRYKGGNFSISIITLRSAFENQSLENNWNSPAFDALRKNRKIISARRYHDLTSSNPNINPSLKHPYNDGYFYGYGPTSQDVLVPAFLSAYTGIDPEKITFDNFFYLMMPNWRLTFDGLSKIKFIQNFLKSITLSHSYKSTYTIGSFGTNVSYYENLGEGYFTSVEQDGFRGLVRDNQMNFISEYQFGSVSINEQINPLIGIDMTWHNSLITKFEMGRSRMISLSFNNNQVNETRKKDYTVGAGYRFKEVPITINQRAIKSDLNIRFDFSIKNNFTIIRFLEEDEEEEDENKISTGGRQFNISFTADYVFSENFNIQFYFDREVNTPWTSETFPRAETNVGFSLRLSL